MSEPPGAERRRSPRTSFEGSVSIQGRSPRGAPLATSARALNVSAHGAKLECGFEFARGTEVVIQDPLSGGSATYRVVWLVSRPGQRWEVGVELVHGQPPLWGTEQSTGSS